VEYYSDQGLNRRIRKEHKVNGINVSPAKLLPVTPAAGEGKHRPVGQIPD
jgi:hypothetical protein